MKQRSSKRGIPFFLAFVVAFSMIGTAFAAYNPDTVTYPKVDDKTGKISEGDFEVSHTHIKNTTIWVLKQFKDAGDPEYTRQDILIRKAIDTGQYYCVKCADILVFAESWQTAWTQRVCRDRFIAPPLA